MNEQDYAAHIDAVIPALRHKANAGTLNARHFHDAMLLPDHPSNEPLIEMAAHLGISLDEPVEEAPPFDATTASRVYQWTLQEFEDLSLEVTAIGGINHPRKNALSAERALVIRNSDLDKGERYPVGAVKACLSEIIEEKRWARLAALRDSLKQLPDDDVPMIEDAFTALLTLGMQEDQPFDADDAALLVKKMIWQVKRKMWDLKVDNHLMLVFVGTQGGGKSRLVDMLTNPLEEVTAPTNLAEITDTRNIQLFWRYIGVLDELDKADRTNVDSLKQIVSAYSVNRRPMGTNLSVDVRQNMTFIGTANKDVREAIIDETGNRRFAQINIIGRKSPKLRAFWDAVNAFDWEALWRVVDETAADPSIPIAENLAGVQETQRSMHPIELWIENMRANNDRFLRDPTRQTAETLFTEFKLYETDFLPRNNANITSFAKTLSRLSDGEGFPWRREHKRDGRWYVLADRLPL